MAELDPAARNDRAWTLRTKDPTQAKRIAQETLEYCRAHHQRLESARALCVIGASELSLGNHGPAEDALEDSVAILETLEGGAAWLVEACLLLLRCCFLTQRPEDALRYGHRAVAVVDTTSDVDLRSRALNGLGLVYGFMGAYTKSLECLLESVRTRDAAGLPVLGGPLNNMGNVFLLQEDPVKALESFERALAAFQHGGSAQEEIIALGNIGRAFEAMNKPARARDAHAEAVRIARDRAVVDYEAPALAKLGRTLSELGDLDRAVDVLERGRRLSEERGGAFLDEVMLELARVHLKLGRHEEAEAAAHAVASIAERLGDGEMAKGAHEMLARIFEASECWRDALEHHKRYHQLRLEHDRELFSSRTRALQVQHEVERAQREHRLLRAKNEELTDAYGELQALHVALQDQAGELERLSHEDPLTRLHNRRSLEKRLIEERARIERYGGTFSLMVCDIDDFKAANDTFSHAVGDEVLTRIGWILRTSTRDMDVPARFGGEEFVVLLPATSLPEATIVAEKIRRMVSTHPWDELGEGLAITVSIGVAEASAGEPFETVFTAADGELYSAKAAGKNQISVAAREGSL